MISLPGIMLATKRFADAHKIIRTFAQNTSQGMLPNRLPDADEAPVFNTVDATLWFFVAIYKYLKYTGDKKFVQETVMPVLRDIIAWHERGTRYNVHVDEDGLLCAGEPNVELTWMDAKIGDWVVTPRTGKAVEINALWCNALAIFASLSKYFGQMEQAKQFAKKTLRVKNRFQEVFWYEKGGYLYDCVGSDTRDTSIRPNQIFALSLPYPLLEGEKAKKVLNVVTDHLLTPFGLRSLSPQDPKYCSVCSGNQNERDSAYHQGTIWPWLLGAYLTALVRLFGIGGKTKARKIFEGIRPLFEDAGIGTISEIYDAEEPHKPRGCIAQAWSAAELLRAYLEDVVD
jgi:predicted glycogen debranching enzyme